jgi:hypothetical protein
MQRFRTIPQASRTFTVGKALAAIVILVGLALTVPLLGLLMIPAVAYAAFEHAVVDVAGVIRLARTSPHTWL